MNEIEIKILKTIIEYYGEILSSLKKAPVGFGIQFKENMEYIVHCCEKVLEFDAKDKENHKVNWKYGVRARAGYTYIQNNLLVNIKFPK